MVKTAISKFSVNFPLHDEQFVQTDGWKSPFQKFGSVRTEESKSQSPF